MCVCVCVCVYVSVLVGVRVCVQQTVAKQPQIVNLQGAIDTS